MTRNLNFLAAAFAVLSFAASCNRLTPEKMAAKADDVVVDCLPQTLTLVGDEINADLKITWPKDFFCPTAIAVLTPVLVYEGGEIESDPFRYQGESVHENFKTVPVAGGTAKEQLSFKFEPGMERARLELRGTVLYGGSIYKFPTRQVADGVNMTAQFASLDGWCSYIADNYQEVLHRTAEGQINYTVNSSKLRKGELDNESITDYHDHMERIRNNKRYTVKGTQIVSYASPEGGKKFNDKLSDKRSYTAEQAWAIIGKGMKADSLEVVSIGQDWEGFRKAVENSHIKDKDLILRVLSMYSDPAVREKEIRNLSQIYTELKTVVFPELRRSRFITNLDYQNYSAEDLEALSRHRIYMLDEEGLLRLASVTDSPQRKEFIYNFAFEKFHSKRAGINLAVQALRENRIGAINVHLRRVDDEDDPTVINLRGVIAMRHGEYEKAEDLFEKAATAESQSNLGVLYMRQGDFSKAAAVLADGDYNKAVACLMAGADEQAASNITGDDARSEYLRAIVEARSGNVQAAHTALAKALALDPSLTERSKKDIEFARIGQ